MFPHSKRITNKRGSFIRWFTLNFKNIHNQYIQKAPLILFQIADFMLTDEYDCPRMRHQEGNMTLLFFDLLEQQDKVQYRNHIF